LDTDGLLTLWEEGDVIGVYAPGSNNVSYTLTSGAGTPFGVFLGPLVYCTTGMQQSLPVLKVGIFRVMMSGWKLLLFLEGII